MTEPKTKHVYHGMGSLQLLGVVFVTLKLCGVIDWSWWLVLLPFYGPIAVFVLFAALCGFMIVTLWLLEWWKHLGRLDAGAREMAKLNAITEELGLGDYHETEV